MVARLEQAQIEDLVALGVHPYAAMVNVGGGSAYAVWDGALLLAAGGLFWWGRGKGYEAWLAVGEAAKARPLAALRPLLRQLAKIRAGLGPSTKIVAHEAPDAVAFDRLALAFGMTLAGSVDGPDGPVRSAIIFGGNHG